MVTCEKCSSDALELVRDVGDDTKELRCVSCGHSWIRTPRGVPAEPAGAQGPGGGTATVGWEHYLRWNEALSREFFDGRWAGRPVYLDLEGATLDQLAADQVGGGNLVSDSEDSTKSFVTAVKGTLYLPPTDKSLFQRHEYQLRTWTRTGRKGTPPFLALLGLFSLVAEGMRSDGDFRASNYYGRLCQMLGLNPASRSILNKIRNDFMRQTHGFWDALNMWLEDAEGNCGLPTAFAFDYRVHMGVPLSQALVRAGDRDRLTDFFQEYQLTPGQRLARTDMARLLASWMPSSGVSQSLKTLWQRGGAEERIADVACVELEAWTGAGRTSSGQRDLGGLIRVAASLRRQPRLRLHLSALVRGSTTLPAGSYVLGPNASAQAMAALEDMGGTVTLSGDGSDGWRTFEEADLLSMPDLLAANLHLTNARDERTALRREPRRLVLLEYDDEYRRYVEVSRAQIGQETLLLVHHSLETSLVPILDAITRPGFSRLMPTELPGLPQDWIAFVGVEIVGIAKTESPDLGALIPLSWTQVAIGGGLSLPGHATWLRQRPPELRLSSFAKREVAATLTPTRALNGSESKERDLGIFSGTTIVPLEGLMLDDGDYRVVLWEGGSGRARSILAHGSFRLRSAAHPRPLLGDLQDSVASDFEADHAWAALSASPSNAVGAMSVIGGSVGNLAEQPAHDLGTLPDSLHPVSHFQSTSEQDDETTAGTEMRSNAPSCLLGEAHHWMLGSVLPGERPRHVDGTCRYCGLEKWFPACPRFKKDRDEQPPGSAKIATPPSLVRVARVRAIAPPVQVDPGLLLEALCYAGRGSWATFERLAAHHNDAPWFALEMGRLLSSLGHLDLVLDRRTLRPTCWSIAPTVLASLPGREEAVLCGYRSESLLERLAADAAAIGGTCELEEEAGCPPRAVLKGTEPDDLQRICSSVSSSTGIQTLQAVRPAVSLAQGLPTLEAIAQNLPGFVPPLDVGVERFNFHPNRWEKVSHVDEPGAYRFLTRPIRYGFFGTSSESRGRLLVADNRLVKWLAAGELHTPILAYNATDKSLSCVLGGQLPGLFERAAVISSGRPPLHLTNGTVAYRDVPDKVAAGLWRSLGPKSEGRGHGD